MSVSDLRMAATVGLYLIAKRRREEAEERKQEWIDRSMDNLSRWSDFHERNVESIEKLLLNKEKLEGMLESARSDSRRDRVTLWLTENQEKVASLENRNEDLVGKIRDLQSRLQDAGVQNVYVPLTITIFRSSLSTRVLSGASTLPKPNRRVSAPPLSASSRATRGRR